MITTKIKPTFKRHVYEKEAWQKNELVCGIDEVGRSCFAGPVVAAAAIVRPGAKHKYIKDSKILTEEERNIAYAWLLKNSSFGVGIVNNRRIDQVNIYQATLLAMKRALMQLFSNIPQLPSVILVDAMPVTLTHLEIDVVCFNYGERQSLSVAAASIIAKVTRDALMTRMDKAIPGYLLSKNKGYGTRDHRNGLEARGKSIIHRSSFLKRFDDESFMQTSIGLSDLDATTSELQNPCGINLK
jgi:ribonuclease HII